MQNKTEFIEIKKYRCPVCGGELMPPLFSGVFMVKDKSDTYKCLNCGKTFERRKQDANPRNE